MRKRTVLLLVLLTIATFINCKNSTPSTSERISDTDYIPKNLEEALIQIDFNLSDSLRIEIKKKSESDFISETHFGLGIGMRNNWELWKGSDLSEYFNGIGIYHPDDMSGIILRSYHRKLAGVDIKLNDQIAYYQEYWKGVELTRLPDELEHPEPHLEFRVSKSYGHFTKKKKWATLYIQTNSKNKNFWIYDYYHGWKKVDLKVKEKLDKIGMKEIESFIEEIYL